jgi:hypothetical protein
LSITVRDNDNGIPEDKKEYIFYIKSEPSFGTNNEKGVAWDWYYVKNL